MYKTTRNIKTTLSDSQCTLKLLTFNCDADDGYDTHCDAKSFSKITISSYY